MLSREENELITRVGPGTAMGNTMRRYWIPALLAHEIAEPDTPPVRVRLLGEDLVAFRDTQGRIGLLDEYCPHRRASLFFGRNEECGLRCVYHGWKFDVAGSCVDQLNEPAEHQFEHKVHITAYPTVELGGIVWAYLGPPERIPAPPKFAWTQVPQTHRHLTKVIQECNWLQALEGGLDTSHAPIMHRLLTDDAKRGGIKPSNPYVRAKAPNLVVDITDYGYQYVGIRPLGADERHVRTYHFILPFHQIRASQTERGLPADAGHIWVPIDDETSMVYNWSYSRTDEPLNDEDRLERGLGNGPLHVDQTTFRSKANRQNNYLIDRAVQRSESFTGIDGINVQDRAIQESMGPIVDRSKEHLGPADKAIIQMRRLLRQAVITVQEGGTPAGVRPSYYTLRAALEVLPRDVDWREILAPDITPEKILQTV
jgi:phenylpropionate dioxygenase-like ring-hydroxylating dioxygenase large terminal subunit